MNTINPDKLQHSKWTAARPEAGEKHFIVVDLLRDDNENVAQAVLEATKKVEALAEQTAQFRTEELSAAIKAQAAAARQTTLTPVAVLPVRRRSFSVWVKGVNAWEGRRSDPAGKFGAP